MSVLPPTRTPFFVTVFFTANGSHLQITQFSDPYNREAQTTIPRGLELPLDEMEALGMYEVAPEDFALTEFVCVSKQPHQKIIRDGLDLMLKEIG